MTEKKKVTLIVEGHIDPVDSTIHELRKLQSEANNQQGLEVTMNTTQILGDYGGFEE